MPIYENYGDANFFEGGMFIKDAGDGDYEVITCNLINDTEPELYLVEDGAVCITDDWIDFDSIRRCFEDDRNELSGAELARAIIDYYGLEQCGSTRSYKLTSDEVIEFMNDYSSEWEFDSDTWSAGPLY